MTTRCPPFWPARRARNFVKELGEKPTTYAKNMEILAKCAGVHAGQMCHVNPYTFARRHLPMGTHTLETILNKDIIPLLRNETSAVLNPYGSSSWDYHKGVSIRAYVDPAIAHRAARERANGCKWVWKRGTKPKKPQIHYPVVTRGERRSRRDPYDSLFEQPA